MSGKNWTSLLTVVLLAPMAWCARNSLDLRPNESVQAGARRKLMAVQSSAGPEIGLLRRSDLPAGAARTARLNVGDELSIHLFEGVELELLFTKQCESPLGGRSFLATVAGYDGVKNAVVHETVDGLQIDVQDYKHGKVYTVFSGPDGVVVKEIDPNAGKVLPSAPLVPSLPEAPQMSPRRALMSVSQQSSSCVDILMAFDRNAAGWADAQGGGITNFATVTVQKMNLALGNTGLDEKFRFRLVGVIAVPAESDDLNAALDAVTNGKDGWADIKAMRDRVGADIVTTLIDTGSAYGTTGLGWSLMTTSFANFSEYGYNVCSVRAAAQSHVVAHECGHNMGAGHSDRQADSPGPQLYSYSSGYYFESEGTAYHTIMAYNSDGFTQTTYQPVPYFSSPDYSYEGVGVGDASHDNSKTIEQTYSAVSQWRSQVVPESYDVFFTPETGTSFKDSILVTLEPGKAGVEVRYTTDGTMPTASSSRYTGPFALTQTTTVRACTVVDGVAGFVFEATYYKESLGVALNAPQYEWTTGGDSLWEYESTNTYDGVHALVAVLSRGKTAWVKTTIAGPFCGTIRYFFSGDPVFRVLCDGEVIYSRSFSGTSTVFNEGLFRVPSGIHELKFELTGRYVATTGFLDDFRRYDTMPPEILPNGSSSSPVEFEEMTLVTLAHPDATAQLFYTIDGTDPTSEKAVRYEGPFPISQSVTVRACALAAGAGTSPVVEASFSERHRPKPGEWTTNIGGALEAAQSDGRLIAILSSNYKGCYYSQILEPVARGDEFTAWAEANGVYLVSADTGRDVDAREADSRFGTLYYETTLYMTLQGWYYPTFVLTTPTDTSTCVGAFLARTGYEKENGTGYEYDGTCASLVKCFATALGETPLRAPLVTMSSPGAYPRTIAVENPNGTGDVYYTLDGSAPSPRNGIRYVSPVNIASAGGRFMAAVWPSSGTGVSSEVVKVDLRTVAEMLGTDGIVWENDTNFPWTDHSGGWIQGGKNLALTSGSSTSTLKATVSGPGKLVFDCEVISRIGQVNVKLRVNGSVLETWYTFNYPGTYVLDVPSKGTTTIEWVYTYFYYDANDYYGGRIGNVNWVHPLPGPLGVTASDGVYSNGVRVTWKETPGAATYRLYRCADESFQEPVLVRETEKTFGWDFAAEADTPYWYAVAAVNAYGEGERSTAVRGWRSAPLEIVDETLPMAFKSVAYSHRLMARGGKPPYAWEILSLGERYGERRDTPTFAQVGTAKGWKDDDKAWSIDLPFSFPFYGKTYSKAYVSSNGTISFGNSFSDYNESVQTLMNNILIAAFWDDLKTSDGDIYVKELSDSVTVRWAGTAYSGGGSVNFSATLKADGTIRLQYGDRNVAKGLIGISAGDGQRYQLAQASQTGGMANARDIVFEPEGLPEGLRVSTDGVFGGVPTRAGDYRFRIGVTDANGTVVPKICSLTVVDVDESHFLIIFFRDGDGSERSYVACERNRVYNLPKDVFATPPGKRFAGWACSNGRRYDDGMLVFDLAKPGETVTMTAIWE